MGIDSDIDRPQRWGIVPAESNITGGGPGGSTTWPTGPGWPQLDPGAGGGTLTHPQVMSRVSLGL